MASFEKKLLILTQKVDKDDAVLGFFHNWILEFSKNFKLVTVICLQKGNYSLPNNVRVLSLGKEKKQNRLAYVSKFYKFIWQYRKDYDVVFVHMNVEYVILGYCLWKTMAKRVGLWYMHKSVTGKLRLAEKFSDLVFTGSRESFRLPSKKLKILHHGIDDKLFFYQAKENHDQIRILTVSRISHTKQIDKIISLLPDIKNQTNKEIKLKIVGEPILGSDKIYFQELKKQVKDLQLESNVEFLGPIANDRLPSLYHWADIFLNFSLTGSVDKAVLEAMACGTPVGVSNESFKDILNPISADMYFENLEGAGKKILKVIGNYDVELGIRLSQEIKINHNLSKLISDISLSLSK